MGFLGYLPYFALPTSPRPRRLWQVLSTILRPASALSRTPPPFMFLVAPVRHLYGAPLRLSRLETASEGPVFGLLGLLLDLDDHESFSKLPI